MAETILVLFSGRGVDSCSLCRIFHSVYEMMQTIEISTFTKILVKELFEKQQINQNVE